LWGKFIIVFDESAPRIGKSGGVAHFGFRLVDANHIDRAAEAVKKAGGKILSKGEFCPGEPYLFFRDPDGYKVEIAFESPTPVDPRPGK
jgi:catechol 2,3-dioxygenase-like lactoylglutathione lyase family enzyme